MFLYEINYQNLLSIYCNSDVTAEWGAKQAWVLFLRTGLYGERAIDEIIMEVDIQLLLRLVLEGEVNDSGI